MTTRRRLDPAERRSQLLDVGARLFAAKPYDEVFMEEVAAQAGISRALLYRYFPAKRDLFAAIYQRAADRLLAETVLDPALPLAGQVAAGLDAHIDYFEANRTTVLAANRVLAGDPVIQAVITEEMAVLRRRVLDAAGLEDRAREMVSSAVMSWLVFVRTLCVDWLANQSYSRAELRDMCLGALFGALGAVIDLDRLPAGP
ncbi:MAG TPA: helix-turn-helix domain-containing protein [Amycolatopsis sp.]|nr:helix-turn-helix domain-containing protein [Amycolatopsis sp.]